MPWQVPIKAMRLKVTPTPSTVWDYHFPCGHVITGETFGPEHWVTPECAQCWLCSRDATPDLFREPAP